MLSSGVVRTSPSVVDQIIQPPSSECLHLTHTSFDFLRFIDLQAQTVDAEISQVIDGRGISSSGDDPETAVVEFTSKGVAYAVAAASSRILGCTA